MAKRARGLRSNLDRLRLFGDEIAQYNQEVSEGAQRSQQIGWFAKKIRGAQACPFCGDSNDSASKRLQALEANAVMAARVSEFSNATKPVLNEETRRIQEQLRSETEKLEGLRTRIEQLQEWKQIQGRIFEAYRFAGQIDFWVSSRRSIGGEGGLLNKRRRLDEELKELNEQLSDSARQQRHQRAMQTVAEGIAWRASRLRLERAADNPRLSISDLTVHFGRDKHYDTLSEIGSGANHMGYHLATLMSLHKYFIFEETPSVPQFLILDQPTQVYFPEKWPEELDSSLDDIAELSSRLDQYENDILSVRLLFSELANFVTEMSARIQIIVLDHAGAVAREGIPGVNVVDTWRQNDEGLVPADWLS